MSFFKKKRKVNSKPISFFFFLPPPPFFFNLSVSLTHTPQNNSGFQIILHLKMENASIVFPEALPPGYHTIQQFGACGKGANGSQQPAVPWKDRKGVASQALA